MEVLALREIIAANIRRECARTGLSVPMLADQSGVSRASLYRVLRCEASVTAVTLAKLAAAIGTKPWHLLRPSSAK